MRFFDSVAEFGEGHPRAGELAFVADLVRWDPDGGEGAIVLQDGQAVGIDLVGLVNVAHHDLGLGGMGQAWEASGLFDFVDDQIPIADGFEGDGSSRRELGTEIPNGSSIVLDSPFSDGFGQGIQNFELGISFVSVQAYTIHSCFPPFWDEVYARISNRGRQYFHIITRFQPTWPTLKE
jgi:hypothetical protein